MIYLSLLWSFMQIGLFSIGGGYAALPLIQHQAIDVNGWLTMQSFSDIMTISQMTPGPIAINAATFVGIQVAGIPGALVATFGCILPSSLIVTALAWVYYRFKGLDAVQSVISGLRPAVVAMIATAALSLISLAFFGSESYSGSVNTANVILFCLAFAVLRIWHPSPMIVMAGTGIAGLIWGII